MAKFHLIKKLFGICQVRLNHQTVVKDNGDTVFSEILSAFYLFGIKLNSEKVFRKLELVGFAPRYDIRLACHIIEFVKSTIALGCPPAKPFSLNVSGKTVIKHGDRLYELLKKYPQYFVVELTETSPAELKTVVLFTKRLKAAGIAYALDDIDGLKDPEKYVLYAKASYLKIRMPKTGEDFTHYLKVLQLAKELSPNSVLVFENIEDQHQLEEAFKHGGCAQGWYTGGLEPLPEPQAA